MNKYNYTIIEGWWRHNGIWDREEICQNYGILYEDFDGEQDIFLKTTDDWWENLTNEQKLEVYNEFFEEW